MGRARSAVAARTSLKALREAFNHAFSVEEAQEESHDDFFDAVQYCRSHSGEFSGSEGSEGWYFWQVGEWAVAGDVSLGLCKNKEALRTVSETLGEIVICGIDTMFEYAHFAVYDAGKNRRLLILEDDEIVDEGFPLQAERGQHVDDFQEEDAERLWVSYGLPTFEYDPDTGPFICVNVKAIE